MFQRPSVKALHASQYAIAIGPRKAPIRSLPASQVSLAATRTSRNPVAIASFAASSPSDRIRSTHEHTRRRSSSDICWTCATVALPSADDITVDGTSTGLHSLSTAKRRACRAGCASASMSRLSDADSILVSAQSVLEIAEDVLSCRAVASPRRRIVGEPPLQRGGVVCCFLTMESTTHRGASFEFVPYGRRRASAAHRGARSVEVVQKSGELGVRDGGLGHCGAKAVLVGLKLRSVGSGPRPPCSCVRQGALPSTPPGAAPPSAQPW